MLRSPLAAFMTSRIGAYAFLLLELLRALRRSDRNTTMLVSYPKSGVTWLQFMVAEIFRRHFGIASEGPTIRLTELTARHPELPGIKWTHDCGDFIHEDGGRPNAYRLFAYSARWSYRRKRVVLMIRDPRDVVVSNFHQATRRSKRPMPFDSLGAFVRDPLYGFRRIIRFHELWYENRNTPSELVVVRYESLLDDCPGVLSRLLKFMGLAVDADLISEVYDSSRAENLRKLERKGVVEGMRLFGDDPNALKVRKARAGTYLEELTADDIEFCNRLMRRYPSFDDYLIERWSPAQGV